MKKLKKAQVGINIPQDPMNQISVNPDNPAMGYFQNQDSVVPQGEDPRMRRQFNTFQPNAWGLGLMGAYLGSKALLNKSNENHYEAYKKRWIRDYQIPSLIQDPNKFSSTQYEAPMARRGGSMLAPLISQQGGIHFPGDTLTNNQIGPARRQYEALMRIPGNGIADNSPRIGRRVFRNDPIQVGQDYYQPSAKDSAKIHNYTPDFFEGVGEWLGVAGTNIPPPYNPTPNRIIPQAISSSTYVKPPIRQTGGITENPLGNDNIVGTPAQREQANLTAQRIGAKWNLGDSSNLQIGKYLPQYVDPSGRPAQAMPSKQLPTTVPDYVKSTDIQKSGDQYGYVDEHTGDWTPVSPETLNLPRFQQQILMENPLGNIRAAERKPTTVPLPNLAIRKGGGLSREDDYGSKSKPYPSVKSGDFAGGGRSYPIPTRADAVDALRLAGLHGRDDVKAKVYAKYPDLRKLEGGIVMKSGGIHINPANKGKFTETKKRTGKTTEELTHSKNATTRKRAVFAQNARKWHHETGGLTMNTPEDKGAGYYKYPNASSLSFPGSGQRTFVPGPFPLMVQDQNGTQIMTNKPIRTMGAVREIPIYEEGGEVRKQAIQVDRDEATIEAERGELILGAGMPGDVEDQEDRVGVGLYKVGGNKHSSGGTPLKAYPGDFVFSDDKDLAVTEEESKLLIGKEIKQLRQRTPAKLASKYMDLNKFIDMAQDEDQDPISKKTAILNVNNFIDRLAEIALVQEQKKGFPDGVPQFVQTSLDTRFNPQGLQDEINQFRYGGQVRKYQEAGVVTPEIRAKATQVKSAPAGYKPYGMFGDKQYYINAQGETVAAPSAIGGGTPGKPWEDKMISLLQSGVTVEELAQKGHGTVPGLQKKFGQYYVPKQDNNYVYTAQYAREQIPDFKIPPYGGPTVTPRRPSGLAEPTTASGLLPEDDPLDQYTQGSNSQFNLNTAEAYNLLASALPEDSRYPPAFRNYEIQNAKALTASTGRPISEQPYLNSIARSTLGRDDLGSFQASLGAQNQAISQVYGQNIQRADQRDMRLAELEVQDGLDRTQQAEKYDNKLEMLANNKELARRYRRQNIGVQLNQMQKDRESKSLFNVMSDTYQINRDNTIGMKPTYKIVDGKIIPYQRNLADMIKSAGTTTNTQYLERMKGIFDLMNQYGIKSGGSFVDDLIRESAIPPQAATGK